MTAVHVPTIDKRRRIPQKAIDQVVEQIVEKFRPRKIILFGSYARGNPRPESEVVGDWRPNGMVACLMQKVIA